MADNYLQFSETLDNLTAKQEAWLQHQLEPIVVVNGQEFPADKGPDCDEPEYQGFRFLRDYEDLNDDAELAGFALQFQGSGKDRLAWLYAEDNGDVERVAHLVQKFLKKFRPRKYWSLTYATTCSKLCVGEFGGGAVFVTADEIEWESTCEFVAQQRAAFEAAKTSAAVKT